MNEKIRNEYQDLQTNFVRNLDMDSTKADFQLQTIYDTFAKLCALFELTSASVSFYKSEFDEQIGKRDEYIGYEAKAGGVPVVTMRKNALVGAVVIAEVCREADKPSLPDEELDVIKQIMFTALGFASLKRLQRIVASLTYDDENGFKNLRYFEHTLRQLDFDGMLVKMAAFHFNLRHFSLVNQEIGRGAADLVIRNHYDGLKELIGDSGALSRLGGDNFVGICDKSRIDRVIGYLTNTPVVYNASGERIIISASAGIFIIPEDFKMHNTGQVMDKIITSSQVAKTGGGSQIVFFNDRLAAGKEKMMHVQNLFPEALEKEEFKVFYQPKINVDTGDIVGAEALCRWFKGGTIIPPMDFIPVLESTNDICKLDFYMLDHVCKDIRRWLDEGRKIVRVSVNLSRKHMMNIDLIKKIIDTIDNNDVPHKYIEIELTETTTDVEFKDLNRVVSGLQHEGIYTSVDDFGIGYSSLNLIRAIPWNVLKIDKSFLPVDEDDQNSIRSIMFRHVVAMTNELGLECIAEGVETMEQVNVLRENGCAIAQGYYFDKPLPVADFENRLDSGNYKAKLSE